MNPKKISLATRLFAVVAAFCLTMQLSAVNKLYIEPFSVESYDEVEVPVMLDLEENSGAQGLQFDVVLPAQLEMAKAPVKNDSRLTSGHTLSFRAANNRVQVASFNKASIKGTTGPVLYLYVRAKDGMLPEAGEARIDLTNASVVKPGAGRLDPAQNLDIEVKGAAVTLQSGKAWASFAESEITINPDGTARLDVAISNSVPLRGFQLDVTMPAGFTIVGIDQENYTPELSPDRCNPNLTVAATNYGPSIRFTGLVITSEDPMIYGNEGVVFSFEVKAPADYTAADGNIVLSNAEFSNMSSGTILASNSHKTSTVKVRNGGIAYNRALAEIKALEDALAAALKDIELNAYDVKDEFTGEEISQKIDALKDAVNAAYAALTLTDNYSSVMSPAEGIRADIDKLIADAKAAQKAHDEEAAREKAYTDAKAVVKSLQEALDAALAEIAKDAPDVKDNFKGEAISAKIDAMKAAIDAAYNDKSIAGKYDNLVAPAEGIRADIDKLIADAKAAQKAHDDEVAAEAAREKAYTDANAVVKSLQEALDAALAEIAKDAPDVKDNFKGEAISAKIDAMKAAIDAAYNDKSIAGKYDNLVAPADGIRADIDKLIADAKAAQKTFEDDAELQKAYADAKDKLAELEKALNDALAEIAKDAPDVKDNFKGEAISNSISDLRIDILEAFTDKTLGDNYDDVMAPADDIAAAIEALVADAKAAQEAFEAQKEAEEARQEANKEAYDADMAAIDALEKKLEEKLEELAKEHPDYDTSAAEAEIRAAIEEERDKAAEALAAVEDEGEYNNTVDTAAIEEMIESIGSENGAVIVLADALPDNVVIYNLAGRRMARPVIGQINIIVHSDGTVQKAIVK